MATNLVTGRVLLPDGRADRATASLLAERTPSAAAAAVLVKEGARKVFPAAKVKALPPIVPGSRREQFREKQEGSPRAGEVTTITRGAVVYVIVLSTPADAYAKFRDEYTAFVRSVAAGP